MHTDLLVFYDNEIEGHFPPHFKDVYLYGLEREHLVTAVVAMSSRQHLRLPAGYLVLWKKKSPQSFIGRLIYSLQHLFRVLIFCLFNPVFRQSKNILVHNDPILCLMVSLLAPAKARIIYRITHLKYEEVRNAGGKRQQRMAAFAMSLRSTAIRRSDRLVVMSDSMKEYFVQREKKLEPASVSVIASMIDTSIDFESEEIEKDIEDFTEDGFVMVYVGTLALSRDLEQMLNVLATVIKRHKRAKLLVLGQGDSSRLEEKARQLGLAGHLKIVEALPEAKMLKVISLCDLGISHYPYDLNPAFRFNSPVKLLNYIQCGIPVVGTTVPDQVYILSQAGKGILVENSDQAYVDAIEEIITHLRRYVPDPVKDRKWLQDNRSLDVAVRKILELCQ